MAEDIGGICREYVDENASKYDGVDDAEAVKKLAIGARGRLEQRGWGDAATDYGVSIDDLVRDQLQHYRSRP